MKCEKCGKEFKRRNLIDGKIIDSGNRKWCLDCSPIKQHRKGIISKTLVLDKPQICKTCGKEFTEKYSKFSTGKYCSKRCGMINSAKTNKGIKKEVFCKICGKKITVGKCSTNDNFSCDECKKPKCKICGQQICKRKDICKKHRIFPSLIKYFGFDKNKIGTVEVYEEFERIKNLVFEEYEVNKLSTIDLENKYGISHQTICQIIFKNFNIKSRNLQQAQINALLQNKPRGNCVNQYKCGWHISWNDKKVFYRSSYELDYCKELDEKKIDYEVEKLRILYWDSQKQIQRVAIPDFYLTETNEIVEIKSDYTYDEINMKDKFKAYKEHGYKTKLILEHKEINTYRFIV